MVQSRPPIMQGGGDRVSAPEAQALKPGYHITAATGWMNDPNGMTEMYMTIFNSMMLHWCMELFLHARAVMCPLHVTVVCWRRHVSEQGRHLSCVLPGLFHAHPTHASLRKNLVPAVAALLSSTRNHGMAC